MTSEAIDWVAAGLGEVPDPVVASRLGLSKHVVRHHRLRLGIPAAPRRTRRGAAQRESGALRAHLLRLAELRRRRGDWVDWSAPGHGLGVLPDERVAERVGRCVLAVAQARRRRGIPSFRRWRIARNEARRLFEEEAAKQADTENGAQIGHNRKAA